MKKPQFLRLFALIAVVFVLSVLPTGIILSIKNDAIKKKFFGEEAKLQGVLIVWNIDTFEGGSGSKESFLEKAALAFEQQNKGLYVLVKNISVEEMTNELQKGIKPDVFSFGSGIGNELLPNLSNMSNKTNVLSVFQNSAIVDGKLKAAAWTFGGYFLLSTPELLEKANVQDQNLMNVIFSAGYQKQVGKKLQTIASVTWGNNNYYSAVKALEKYVSIDQASVGANVTTKSAYDAYVLFSANKSTILLGTHRDVARLENKLSQGSISAILNFPLSMFSDMVQYVGIANQTDELRLIYSQKFVDFLTSEAIQTKLKEIGMFSTTGIKLYESGPLADYEKSITNIEIMKLFG